jgi:hypothetical protein
VLSKTPVAGGCVCTPITPTTSSTAQSSMPIVTAGQTYINRAVWPAERAQVEVCSTCGNGTCEFGEDNATCPADCP